jgi:hypothetical protein
MGGVTGSVFAFKNELDTWIGNRGKSITTMNASDSSVIESPSVPSSQAFSTLRADYSLIPQSAHARSAELAHTAYEMLKTLSHGNMNLIARLFREAVELDPCNADAYAGLGYIMVIPSAFGLVHPLATYDSARFTAEQALELDPKNAEARCTMAWLDMFFTREWGAARQGFTWVQEQAPPHFRGLVGLALIHVAEGHPDQAVRLLRSQAPIGSLSSISIGILAWCEYLAGNAADSLLLIEQSRAAGYFGMIFDVTEALASIQLEHEESFLKRIRGLVAESPQCQILKGVLGYAYAQAGLIQMANEMLHQITAPKAAQLRVDPYAHALVLIGLKENQKACQLLAESYHQGSLWSLGFLSDPIVARLPDQPSCAQLLKRIHSPVRSHQLS